MEEMNSTIKRLYDQYKPQDFKYGAAGSDNLNPQREMLMDQIDAIEKKIQDVTDEIVRKKINKKQDTENLTSTMSNESSGQGFEKALNDYLSGGGLNTVLPDSLIGTFSGSTDELSGPISVDCSDVLKKYGITSSYSEYKEDEDGEETQVINSSSSLSKTNSDGSTTTSSSSSDDSSCEDIELEWLKYLILILNFITILKVIIDYMISVTMMIIKIVTLASQAWINPPAIAQITQILIGLTYSCISMITSLVLQTIWDGLNLDCISDNTQSSLNKIKELMSKFNSLIGSIDPNAVSLYCKTVNDSVGSIDENITKMLDNKKELYDKMVKDYKKEINDIGSDTDKVENDLKTMLKDAVLDGSSEQTSQVVKVYKQSLDLYDSTVEAYKNTKSKIKGLYKALKDNTTIESQEALIKSKSKNKDINMLIDDSTIRIC